MRNAIEVIGRGISKRNYRTYMTKSTKIKLIHLLWLRVFFWVETMVESSTLLAYKLRQVTHIDKTHPSRNRRTRD
nr:hypothetical protein CFP56_17075 [Quercus suber]